MAITWGIPHFQINSDDYFGRCRFVFGLKNGHWRLPLPWKNHGKLSAVQISGRCGSRELGDDLLPRRDWVLFLFGFLILQHLFGWSMNWESERALCLPGMGLVLFDCTCIVFVWTRGGSPIENILAEVPRFSAHGIHLRMGHGFTNHF